MGKRPQTARPWEFALAQQQPIRSGPNTSSREIPDKLYFRIGEVARLCEVPAYVLRFWESEFPQLKPNKGGTGQRLYRRRDVETALRIKMLLYDEGYTIAGARQVFKGEQRQSAPKLALGVGEHLDRDELKRLRQVRKEMQELLAMLSGPASAKVSAPIHPIRAGRSKRSGSVPAVENLFDGAAQF